MSFQFGTLNFTSRFADSYANLRVLPSFSGMEVDSLSPPGTDSRIFAGVTREATRLEYDVFLNARTQSAVEGMRDELISRLDPARGPQRMIIEESPAWCWQMVPVEVVDWQRLARTGMFLQLATSIAFESFGDASARQVTPVSQTLPSNATTALVAPVGNTRCWPTVEIQGTLTAAQSVNVEFPGFAVNVKGPLASTQVMRLDWDTMDFAVWNGSSKVRSLVPDMSHFDRPVLWPGATGNVRVWPSGGTLTRRTIFPNSRRQ